MRCALLQVVASLLLIACSDGGDRPAPVPRPRAYPRACIYPRSYSALKLDNGIVLNINDSARVCEVRPGWFDVVYPAYGITVNCTLTQVDAPEISGVIDNRTERMARNLEGNYGEVAQRPGVTIITSATALRTPVQFLATDSASYVLSGVAVADFPPGAPADSVAPYVRAVAADVEKMLELL